MGERRLEQATDVGVVFKGRASGYPAIRISTGILSRGWCTQRAMRREAPLSPESQRCSKSCPRTAKISA
jgi:hypothetical protein